MKRSPEVWSGKVARHCSPLSAATSKTTSSRSPRMRQISSWNGFVHGGRTRATADRSLRRWRHGQYHGPACRFRVLRAARAGDRHRCSPGGTLGSHPEVDAHYRPRRAELEQALAAIGVTVADLRLAANSHLHFDHCGGNPKLARLPVFVQAAELRTARHTPDYTLPELIDRSRFEQLTGPAEVLPGVTLIPTPGHT